MRLFRESEYRVKELKHSNNYLLKIIVASIVLVLLGIIIVAFLPHEKTNNEHLAPIEDTENPTTIVYESGENTPLIDGIYLVESVIDGDTFMVSRDGKVDTVRLIGINTPEIDSPYTTAECYGEEAALFLRAGLEGQRVVLLADPSQDNYDKYGRLLRYASLEDGIDVGALIIFGGFSREYTYDNAYYNQSKYKELEKDARENQRGIWQNGVCKNNPAEERQDVALAPQPEPQIDQSQCLIKGNISYYGGDKIYHVPGQKYYEKTQINTAAGERWFCTEQEAIAAGWRKSKE